MGRLFFDILQPQCVQGRSCAPHEAADICLERLKAEGGAKSQQLRFFETLRRYEGVPGLVADAGGSRGASAGGGASAGVRGGIRTERGKSSGVGNDAGSTVQIAGNAPPKASSSAGGGLSGIFRRLLNQLG